MTEPSAAQRLFVGVGVGTYDHRESFGPLGAAEEVVDVAQVLEGMGYAVQPCVNLDFNEAGALLDELAARGLASGSCLVVLWAGHGEPVKVGGLHLVARNSRPGQVQ
ncbi:MAG: caspase family protein, partial [Cyanobium sp.]